MNGIDYAVPVTVLTGFLGSGKTTLLKRLLECEEGLRTAVLINEFGETSIDHLLARSVTGNTVVLRNGCVCCSVRSELRQGLRGLLDSRTAGAVPAFGRIVIETTGLADPVPVVQTLVADPMLRHQVRLAGLVSTVDALNGSDQLEQQIEAIRQVATADRLVITKIDLVADELVAQLEALLKSINPTAKVFRTSSDADVSAIFPGTGTTIAGSVLQQERALFGRAEEVPLGVVRNRGRHSASLASFAYRPAERLDWAAFAVWLSLFVHRYGTNILRVKGSIAISERQGPVLLNVVQRFIHPPVHLDSWPDEDCGSRLVFIVQGPDPAIIQASLERFLQQAEEADGGRIAAAV